MEEKYIEGEKYMRDGELDVPAVVAEFKKLGYDVTEEAIIHNWYAWEQDLKSGYKDEENGYFLFSPCGCNPLMFHAMPLNGNPAQMTYTA